MKKLFMIMVIAACFTSCTKNIPEPPEEKRELNRRPDPQDIPKSDSTVKPPKKL